MKRRELIKKAKEEAAKIDAGEAVALFQAFGELGKDLVAAAADGKLTAAEALELAADLKAIHGILTDAIDNG